MKVHSFGVRFRFVAGLMLVVHLAAGSLALPVAAQPAPKVAASPVVVDQLAPALAGTSECNLPPLSVLPNATVTIFSGSAQVAATSSDANGAWSVPGSAPNAKYVVRYAKLNSETGQVTACGVSVTTDATGAAVAPAPATCPPANLVNRTWTGAFALPASANGTTVTDAICAQGQSRWYRVPVLPGQRVTAEIDNPSFDVTVGLYKDIQQVASQMDAAVNQPGGLTQTDVQRFTASIGHDSAAPDGTAPDGTAPDGTAPDGTAPDGTAPDGTAPDGTAPDGTAPDGTAPDGTAPDGTATDPSVNADTYLAAQSVSLVAYSDKPGLSAELVRRHTWDNTGNYYVRVGGHNGTFDETHTYTLKVTVINADCVNGDGGRINLQTYPVGEFGMPRTPPRTLILTDTARFPADSDTETLISRLQAYAARPEVSGYVFDLAASYGLGQDYSQWDQHKDCVPAANIVVDQIHSVVQAFHNASPGTLQNVVVVGGDAVIPFGRIPDQSSLSNERDYSPAVFDASASQASLKLGYFLSQDIYGSFTAVSVNDHTFNSFDVPVGRLVENVPDILTMLDAYTSTNGVVAPRSALVTGYDFMADASSTESSDLSSSGVSVDSLIEPVDLGPLNALAWSADAVRSRLFGQTQYGILDLNGHFSGNTFLAADEVTRIRSGEIATVTDHRFLNSVVLSMGCHSGYNIVDADATPGTPPVDWAQAFAIQGATVIGGAGYQYGSTPLTKYSDVLLENVTHELRLYVGEAPAAVALGRAVLNAKRNYIQAGMTGIDEKSVAELTLYGLPTMGVNLPSGRIARPSAPPPVFPQPGTAPGIFRADVAPGYTLSGHDRVLTLAGQSGTTTATYYTAAYGTVVSDAESVPGRPVTPQVVTSVAANGMTARGAVLLGANYTDVTSSLSGSNGFRPLVDIALTENRGVRPAYASSVFAPEQLVSVNDVGGQFLVEHPFQFRSSGVNNDSVFGTGRRYDSMSTRVYYTSRGDIGALEGPPVIYNTKLTANGSVLLVDVTVGASNQSLMEDVFATFTSDPTDTSSNTLYGRWSSIALTRGPATTDSFGLVKHYTGSIDASGTGANPASLRLFIQAAGGNGLVSVATNNGNDYQLVTETATLGSPKATTALAFQQPAGNAYTATYRSPFHVSALLTNAVTGAPIANKLLTFAYGAAQVHSTTGSNGVASAELPALVAPDVLEPQVEPDLPLPQVTVGFAEDTAFLASGDIRDVQVGRAQTAFTVSVPAVQYGNSQILATLNAQLPSGTSALREVGVHVQLSDGRQLDTMTDGFGRVLFDTLDFSGVQPGSYPITLSFGGNDRYLATSTSVTQSVGPGQNHSVAFNGASGFVEAPASPDLNPTGDWTVEAWFKDEDPNGFNHDYRQILMKGDHDANPEAPYFVLIGQNTIIAGVRTGGVDYPISYSLTALGLVPNAWHHVAVNFLSSQNTLNLFIDGQRIYSHSVAAHSTIGNSLPLEIGRNGPLTGKYWLGKIDDVRIFNVFRTAVQIASDYQTQLTTPPPGLVANWKFDERLGTLSAYSSPDLDTATLSTGGAAFSTDVHP